MRTLAAHHAAMGGVPLLAAFDRPRPIGVRADDDGQVTEWDQAFAYAALELGVGVEVRARRGAERGPGTNLGNWLKLAFFKTASFADEADAAEKLGEWLRDYNARAAERGRRQGAGDPARGGAAAPAAAEAAAARARAARSRCWSVRARRSCTKDSRTRCRPRRSG